MVEEIVEEGGRPLPGLELAGLDLRLQLFVKPGLLALSPMDAGQPGRQKRHPLLSLDLHHIDQIVAIHECHFFAVVHLPEVEVAGFLKGQVGRLDQLVDELLG